MKLRKSEVNPIYYDVVDGYVPDGTTVRIQVGGCEAENSARLREGIENCIVNCVNRQYDGLDYLRKLHPEFNAWSVAHRLYALLSDHGDTLDLNPLLDDLIEGVPEYERLWRAVKAKQNELALRMLQDLGLRE